MGRGVAIGVTVGEREDADGPGSHGHQQHPLRRPHAPATPALPQRACQVKLVKLHTTIFLDSIKKKENPRTGSGRNEIFSRRDIFTLKQILPFAACTEPGGKAVHPCSGACMPHCPQH